MSPPDAPALLLRRRYIDWARGLAVLIMIQAHTLDAWTRPSNRSSWAYGRLSMLGGFAAPLFLWLAGVSLALAAERTEQRTGSRAVATQTIVRRGAEIFILAFLFRLQAFIVSPGSWPITIFRVDILNVMGLAIAGTGLVWGASRGRRGAAAWCGAAAGVIAMTTPIVRNAYWVNVLPLWVQWHLRPSGDHTTFTLLPWAGFVFAGAACGVLLAASDTPRRERLAMVGLTLSGTLLVWLGFYTASLPSIYRESSFWSSSPTFFAIRMGVMLVALGALFAMAQLGAEVQAPFAVLEKLGRNSLFIYWIHIELVYGYATWILHRRLPLWGTLLACAVFMAAMYAAIPLRDRLLDAWRASRSRKPADLIESHLLGGP